MKRTLVAVIVAGSLLCGSCTFLDNLANNLSSIANLANCEYTLKDVSNVSVAGVNVKNVTSGNISATDVVKLVSAITTKSVPLALNVNINVKNPTTRSALLTMMDWALDIAKTEFATGVTNQNYNIGFPEVLNIMRVDYSCEYIRRHPQASQEDVARACGFLSASTFNSTFKRVTGYTPKVWAARMDSSSGL